jgi:hypothetical protein
MSHNDLTYNADPNIGGFRQIRSDQHRRMARVPLQNASDREYGLVLYVRCLMLQYVHTS